MKNATKAILLFITLTISLPLVGCHDKKLTPPPPYAQKPQFFPLIGYSPILIEYDPQLTLGYPPQPIPPEVFKEL
ncbi:hypothetical protein H1S01_19695 [Heliobacterium chlorum]|uniref:Lipoprotein n=1 Tax=Heliobacterium chlorum TaxID=2698 RepID=A0ABR7T952_HELCL|nr:hypothetical protein [Heliobacterium chlorum]MBC9786668.1 hypothetical protein [Heliobacterium chlorum]